MGRVARISEDLHRHICFAREAYCNNQQHGVFWYHSPAVQSASTGLPSTWLSSEVQQSDFRPPSTSVNEPETRPRGRSSSPCRHMEMQRQKWLQISPRDEFSSTKQVSEALNRFSYNCLIHLCGVLGRMDDAVSILKMMIRDGGRETKPDSYTYGALLKAGHPPDCICSNQPRGS